MKGDESMHERLRELRLQMGKTQQEIAAMLCISSSAYSLYETGKRQLNYENMLALADYFDVSLDYLFGRTEIKKYPPSFTTADYQFLRQYKSLDERGRQTVRLLLNFESSSQTKD